MTAVESTRKALGGMQKIELEIIGQVRGRGARIDPKDFSWNHGRSLAELPSSSVHVELRVGSKHVRADWPRSQLEASWNRIDRMDVHQGIDRIVEELAPARIRLSNKPYEIK